MIHKDDQQLGDIFRTIEADLGTTGLLNLVLEVIVKAAKDFRGKQVDGFLKQLRELFILIKNTRPRIGIVIYYLFEIWDEIDKRRKSITNMEELVVMLEDISNLLLKESESDICSLIENGVKCIKDNDSILIHSHSKTVLRIIEKAFKQKKKFRIILAEQEEEKTHDIINFLHMHGISFQVVPEFMLSHIENEVTKVFLGAITLNKNYNFVADSGTRAVVSEFHHEHIPLYNFLVTKKFSLWEDPVKHHTYKVVQKKIEKHSKNILEYEKIKFSHDRVPLDSFDYVVTEKGVFSPKEIEGLYEKMFKERTQWRKRHFPVKE